MQPAFTRGFRLHHNGRICDGAEFPSGRVYVLDDPEYGLATVATSMEHLLKGYHGARVEWAGNQLVPTDLLLDLVRAASAARLSNGLDIRAHGAVAALSKHLGYDVAALATESKENHDGR